LLRGEANPWGRGPFWDPRARGKGVAQNGPPKWPSLSPPL